MLKYKLTDISDLPEATQALYKKVGENYILQVEGAKTQADIDEIKGYLATERESHKTTKTKLKEYDDIRGLNLSPTELLEKLDRFDELEAAAEGKLDEEKINEIAERRVKARIAPIERERDKFKNELLESQASNESYVLKDRTRSIHDVVREATTGAKIVPTAVEDVLMLAERLFEVGEDGNVVSKDNVGITPGIEPTVWLSEIAEKRPHWFAPNQGGGASGQKGGAGFSNNPFSTDSWNMTEQGKLVRENPERADQMAKSAGTTIGGGRPPKN